MIKRLGGKKTFIVAYIIVGVSLGSILAIKLFLETKYVNYIIPFLLFGSTFGIVTAFLSCYTSTFELFPLSERSTAMKICNLSARFITIFAPLIAEINPPTPLIVMLGFVIVSLLTVTGLDESVKKTF